MTDSKISLVSIKNVNIHSYLIEEIRDILSKLERSNWTGMFVWVNTMEWFSEMNWLVNWSRQWCGMKIWQHPSAEYFWARCSGSYKRNPSLNFKKKKACEESPKAAQIKRLYPNITDRLKSKIVITSNFTAMISGHWKPKPYLHRFKLLGSATCPCNKGDQTTGHHIHLCTLLHKQRGILEKDTFQHDIWPISKHELITGCLR